MTTFSTTVSTNTSALDCTSVSSAVLVPERVISASEMAFLMTLSKISAVACATAVQFSHTAAAPTAETVASAMAVATPSAAEPPFRVKDAPLPSEKQKRG